MKTWGTFTRVVLLVPAVVIMVALSWSCSRKEQDAPEKTIELSFWHGLESQLSSTILEEKISQFQAVHPKIHIKAQHYGAADQVKAKIMTAIAGNQPPDLLWWGPQATGLLARSGALLNLVPLMDADKEFDRSLIYPRLWDLCAYEGGVYAVPFDANNLGLYYNKAHFRAAGIDPASLNTWEGFLTAARKLTVDENNDGTPERYGFQVPLGHSEWTVWVWQTFLWQAGGEFLNAENTRTAFDSQAGYDALSLWVDLVHTHKVANFSEPDAGYKTDDFLAGRISMMINGPWNFGLLVEAKEKNGIDYGALPLPSKVTAATNIGGENLFVFKTDSSKDSAKWAFAKFILSPQFQTDWAIKTGYLPINKRVLKEEKYQKFIEANPFIKVYNTQMPKGRTRPTIPSYPNISDILGRQIEKALYRKVAVNKALTVAAEQADKILAEEK